MLDEISRYMVVVNAFAAGACVYAFLTSWWASKVFLPVDPVAERWVRVNRWLLVFSVGLNLALALWHLGRL